MSDAFNLGNTPLPMTVTLTRGADFITTLRTADESPWPDAVTCRLDFDDTVATSWSATVVDDEIRFNVDKVDVDALIDSGPDTALLVYVDGAVDLAWGRGRVIVYA